MNTRLRLRYTDAGNYKSYEEVIVAGAITQAHIERFHPNLIDDQFIIAHQVGLPTPSGLDTRAADSELDHVLTEMEDFGEEAMEMMEEDEEWDIPALLTDNEPTLLKASGDPVTIDELTDAIANATWDFSAEMQRVGLSS